MDSFGFYGNHGFTTNIQPESSVIHQKLDKLLGMMAQ